MEGKFEVTGEYGVPVIFFNNDWVGFKICRSLGVHKLLLGNGCKTLFSRFTHYRDKEGYDLQSVGAVPDAQAAGARLEFFSWILTETPARMKQWKYCLMRGGGSELTVSEIERKLSSYGEWLNDKA